MSIQTFFCSRFFCSRRLKPATTSRSARRRPIRRRPAAFRPQLEVLEDRLALDATFLTLTEFSQTASWSGGFQPGQAVASPRGCVDSSVDLCDWVQVHVDLPEGVWAEPGGMLVTIQPRNLYENNFYLYIYAPGVDPVTGTPISKSENLYSVGVHGVWVENPVNTTEDTGPYTVVVIPKVILPPEERATYDGLVSFDRGLTVRREELNNSQDVTQTFVAFGLSSPPESPVELLPDLVPITPSDFHIETGTCTPGSLYLCFIRSDLRQEPSCYPEETAGLTSIPPTPGVGPTRCLRFTQGESNFGDGPLELHLYPSKGTPDPDDAQVQFNTLYQRVYRSDGSVSQQPVGEAEFHESHGHYHGLGWRAAALHKLLPNGKPGEIVIGTDGKEAKMKDKGVCTLDVENPRFGQRRDSPQAYGNEDLNPCSNPSHQDPNDPDPAFRNVNYIQSGISVGWSDVYPWALMDQYIDITTVPDGTYALVATVALDDRLNFREKSTANNTAIACVTISGITATATPCQASDLTVSNIVAANHRGPQGDKVTITATIANLGTADVGPSQTEFLLDGTTVVGLIDTPAIPAGGAADVSVSLDTQKLKGTHTIRVTADQPGIVAESDETNNAATLTLTVKGNQVQESGVSSQESEESSEPPAEGASTPSGSASGEFVAVLLVEEDAPNSTSSGETTGSQSSSPSDSDMATLDVLFAATDEEIDSILASAEVDEATDPLADLLLAELEADLLMV